MTQTPAILGGKPAFEAKVQMVRPVLPSFADLEEGIKHILSSGMVTRGRYLAEFEAAAAAHLGVKHAVAVSSCTSGLILAFRGLGLTGDVVVPSFTFMATASALTWAGLRPVFADADPESTTLDPDAAEAAITPQTTAIVAVHNFGAPADIAGLQAVADRHGLKLIFDAAHGFGARYQGVPVGGQGDAQVFSMSPTKLLITGEGGLVSTNSDDLAAKIRIGREYGNDGHYDTAFPGLNARMPEFNALMGVHSLGMLEHAAESRNGTADIFREELGQLPGIGFQSVRPGDRHSYREFSLVILPGKDGPTSHGLAAHGPAAHGPAAHGPFGLTRDQLALALAAENVDSRKYYDPPIHCQTAYRQYDDGRPLPHTEFLSANSLSLPMWTNMEPDVVHGIIGAFRKIHANAAAIRTALAG